MPVTDAGLGLSVLKNWDNITYRTCVDLHQSYLHSRGHHRTATATAGRWNCYTGTRQDHTFALKHFETKSMYIKMHVREAETGDGIWVNSVWKWPGKMLLRLIPSPHFCEDQIVIFLGMGWGCENLMIFNLRVFTFLFDRESIIPGNFGFAISVCRLRESCLLYTSDAADER